MAQEFSDFSKFTRIKKQDNGEIHEEIVHEKGKHEKELHEGCQKNRNETKGNEEKRHRQGKTREIIGVPWNQGAHGRWPEEIRFGPQQEWKGGLPKGFRKCEEEL